MFSSIGSPSIMFDRIGAAVERMAQYKAILRMLPRVCLISTRTFPVISCVAFCAAALAEKSPPSRGENNRGALSAIGKRLPIIDGDLPKVHAMPILNDGLAAKQMDAIVTHEIGRALCRASVFKCVYFSLVPE